ncbi:MAG: methyltransferase [Spirochaetales bacterium]|nr:methyltransferase [Spirochaetales bacterium]
MDTDSYVSRTVRLRAGGRELVFDLSHALFSSADIDVGSRLLLKAIAGGGWAKGARRGLDLGCGVGTLALALTAMEPGLAFLCRDRDALARDFTLRNAGRNGIELLGAERALFLQDLEGGAPGFDLLVSNVPAKAGAPVLADLLARSSSVLTPGGKAAWVIVKPLAAEFGRWIEDAGLPLLGTLEGSGHTVYATGKGPARSPEPDPFAVYRRTSIRGSMEGREYPFEGRWGLPEFDAPSWDTELAAWAAERASAGRLVRAACLVEPGAGHLAAFLQGFLAPASLALVTRDALAAATAARNSTLAAREAGREGPDIAESDDGADLRASSFDLLVELALPVPGRDWSGPAWERVSRLLKEGGAFVAAGTATELSRLERHRAPGFRGLFERKRKGYAVHAFEKSRDATARGSAGA